VLEGGLPVARLSVPGDAKGTKPPPAQAEFRRKTPLRQPEFDRLAQAALDQATVPVCAAHAVSRSLRGSSGSIAEKFWVG
jgi:hypothetical protein